MLPKTVTSVVNGGPPVKLVQLSTRSPRSSASPSKRREGREEGEAIGAMHWSCGEPMKITVEPATKFRPVTVMVKAGDSGPMELGLSDLMAGPVTAKERLLESPTDTNSVPAAPNRAGLTAAVRVVPLTKVVGRADPFHRTTLPVANPEPVMTMVVSSEPTGAEEGLSDNRFGAGEGPGGG